MNGSLPRLMIAAASGDGGKTLVALALTSALRRRGIAVAPFKKGPDYIDAGWLSLVAGAPCRNLDAWMMGEAAAGDLFARSVPPGALALIEANRGLHDGLDARGSASSAELAILLDCPVLLVLDASKATRTLAAIALGLARLDPRVGIAGVVLNRLAGERHLAVARQAIEEYAGIPVLGAIPKLADAKLIPGRHLGLVTAEEFPRAEEVRTFAADLAEAHLDLDAMIEIAHRAPAPPRFAPSSRPASSSEESAARASRPARIGVVRDSAFCFYYPENLQALIDQGAELAPIDSLRDPRLPADLDALYIGGGFPETHAESLSNNAPLREDVRAAAAAGLPIYAECGGLIFLSRALEWRGRAHPMCDVLPFEVKLESRPRGHGYCELAVDAPNPFFATGAALRGHEFHYSAPVGAIDSRSTCCAVSRGVGLGGGRDGFVVGGVFAGYTHLHAVGTPEWASGLVGAARRYADSRRAAAAAVLANVADSAALKGSNINA